MSDRKNTSLTRDQELVAGSLSDLAEYLYSDTAINRLMRAALDRFPEPQYAMLLVQTHFKLIESAKALVSEFRAERFSTATVINRVLFEHAAIICWANIYTSKRKQQLRLLGMLGKASDSAVASGATLSDAVSELHRNSKSKNVPRIPSFRDALKQLDAAEKRLPDGTPFWESHYGQYEIGSDHVHPEPLSGPGSFSVENGNLVVRHAHKQPLGFAALSWGYQYFALGITAVAMLAGDNELPEKIVANYEPIRDVIMRERKRLGL